MSGKAGRGAGSGRGARAITCPACGKPTVYAESNPSRPFCSARCRLTDLGAWASEAYRIPAPPAEDEGTGGDEEPKD